MPDQVRWSLHGRGCIWVQAYGIVVSLFLRGQAAGREDRVACDVAEHHLIVRFDNSVDKTGEIAFL